MNKVFVNQVGFLTGSDKKAVLNFNAAAFDVIDDKEKVVKNISERASKLISDDLECQREIKKDIIKIYKNRSKFVHHGMPYVHKNDLNRLTNYVRIVILEKNKENKLKKFKR